MLLTQQNIATPLVTPIDILYTLDSASLLSKIEAKNIPAVTPI
jgi:hypothetical protein